MTTNRETVLTRLGLEGIESNVFLEKKVIQVLPKETTVLDKGSTTDALYIVLEGRVKVVETDSNGDEQVLSCYFPGDYFGWMGGGEGLPRASIVTAAPSRFLVLPKHDLKAFLSDNQLFKQRLLETLVEESEQKSRELSEALQQKTAISDILHAISKSPSNVQSILETVAKNAARLCDVNDAEIFKVEGNALRLVAKYGHHRLWPIGTLRPLNRDWVAGRAIVDRCPIHVDDLQAATAEFPLGATLAKQFGHRTTFVTPLLREGIAIGGILIRRMEVRPFTEKQIVLIKTFADEAAIAIENVRLFNEVEEKSREVVEQAKELDQWNAKLETRVAEQAKELTEWNIKLETRVAEQVSQLEQLSKLEHELLLASEIQKSMLPTSIPRLEGFEFSATMLPAKSVGGDFFDFIPLGENLLGIAVGDVADKGVPAALFMAMVRSLLRAEAHPGRSVQKVLRSVNLHLMDMNDKGMFVTIIFGVLNAITRQFQYVRAGHEIPVFSDGHGSIKRLPKANGQALGVFKEIALNEQMVELSKGSMLLLYTDGITDAHNRKNVSFGHDGLAKTVGQITNPSAPVICDELIKAASKHQAGSLQFDDMTVVVIRAI